MKKTILTAVALGALAMNLNAQTWTPGSGLLYTNPTTTKVAIGTTAVASDRILSVAGNIQMNTTTNPGSGQAAFSLRYPAGSGGFGIGAGGEYAGFSVGNIGGGTNTLYLGVCSPTLATTPGAAFIGDHVGHSSAVNTLRITSKVHIQPFKSYSTAEVLFEIPSAIKFSTQRSDFHNKVVIGDPGAVNIITASPANSLTDPRLFVQGGILTEKLKVAPRTSGTDWAWPDYVFSKDYKLNSLDSVETFISKNSHLPDVPSAKEVNTNGIDVADMDAKLLRKVEELTLYVIDVNKKLKEQEKETKHEVAILKKKIQALEVENETLKK